MTNGIPIGPPFHVPEPKSGCSVVDWPIVAMYSSERSWTGSVSTGVFQMLSDGNIGQPERVGPSPGGGGGGGGGESSVIVMPIAFDPGSPPESVTEAVI